MKKSLIVLFLILIVIVLTIFWWENGTLPVNKADKTPQVFVVKQGEGVRQIANNLKEHGLIRDPIVFFLLTKMKGIDKQIQAGDFRLNPSMNANQIGDSLTHGILDIWVTIPEGKRADEIADLLKAKLPTYEDSWRDVLKQNEGYLFPDTYLFPKDADINQVLDIMRNNFDVKYDLVKDSKSTTLSDRQTVILASLVEREAKTEVERPLVASVIYNRLTIGMKLDVDATVQYALGFQPDENRWWKKNLTFADLKINSPYNTYTNPGLPPAPISNPGISAIKAALDPADTSYFYYMTDPKGVTHFAKTLEEQEANIQKYR